MPEKWWTQLPLIRTIAEIDLEFPVFVSDPFQYQVFAEKIQKLHLLGMKVSEIARSLGLEPKTVKRGLKWLELI
ncbi:MAG: hypothetical protein R3B45_00350 [Bdellovibrionota bacterium]